MFNFAAAFSERIRYSRSTKLVPFVPDDGEQSSAPAGEGGGGDENHGYRGTEDASKKVGGLESRGGVQPRGHTGLRSRTAGQMSGPQWVSQDRIRPGYSAKDERNLKPPQKGASLRSLLPRKSFWRLRHTKVHPLNIKGSLPAYPSRPSIEDSSCSSLLTSATASAALGRSKHVARMESCRTPTGTECTSSDPPDDDEDASSSAIQGQPGHPGDETPHRPWTTRLRSLLVPRRRRRTTAVVPFETQEGLVIRHRGSPEEEQGDRGHQTHDQGALKTKKGAMNLGGKEASPVSAAITRPRQSHVTMTTRPSVPIGVAPLPIPGVPQFDLDNQSVPSPASKNGTSIPSQRQGVVRLITPSSFSRQDSSTVYSSISQASSSHDQEAVRDGGDTVFNVRRSILKPARPTSTSRIYASSLTSPSYSSEKQERVKEDGDRTSEINGRPISKPVQSKKTVRFKETETNVTDKIHSQSIKTASPSLAGATLPVGRLPLPHSTNKKQSTTSLVKKRRGASQREERIALKVDVTFIFLSIVGRGPSSMCRWAEVMQSCINRRKHIHRMLAATNQCSPYTRDQVKEIEMNARTAAEKLNLLNQMVTAANFIQTNPGDVQRGLFHHIDITPSQRKRSEVIPSRNGSEKAIPLATEKVAIPHPPKHSESISGPRQTSVGCSQPHLANHSRNLDTANLKSCLLGILGATLQAKKSPSAPQQAAGNSQSSPAKISKKASHNSLTCNILGRVSQAQKSSSNPRRATPAGNPHSSLLKLPKNSSPTNSNSSVFGITPQVQNSTSFTRLVAPPGTPQSPQNASATTMNGASISPANTTHPKLAPSCLRKIMPNMPSYPTIDAGDLEYVLSTSGAKVVLGSGDNGEVLLMRRLRDGTLLAVKRMSTNRFRITVDKDMLREVAAMQAVKDSLFFSKLVGVIDYCSFAQEFIGDASTNSATDFLTARYDNSLLTPMEWLHVCRDVTEGLMTLHRAGWLHNDLHCRNAMVSKNPPGSEVGWTGKIIDLGCAQQLQSLPPPFNLTKEEKERYYKDCTQVAPEIVEGKTQFSVQADVYSLGKLFVDMANKSSSLHSLRYLGLTCMKRDPDSRPQMRKIYKKLDLLCFKMALSKMPPLSPP